MHLGREKQEAEAALPAGLGARVPIPSQLATRPLKGSQVAVKIKVTVQAAYCETKGNQGSWDAAEKASVGTSARHLGASTPFPRKHCPCRLSWRAGLSYRRETHRVNHFHTTPVWQLCCVLLMAQPEDAKPRAPGTLQTQLLLYSG